MKGAICVGFSKDFNKLNLKLKNEDEKKYDYAILLLYLNELDRGFKVKKINKTTNKGTKVSYIAIKTEEELNQYMKEVSSFIDEFNKKWNEDLKLTN